jgi:hypothetical protein
MPLRFGNETIADKLLAANKRLDERRRSLAQSETIIASVEADRDAIAAREHAGELTAKQAADAFVEVDQKERRHHSELGRLTRAVSLSETEIEGLERDGELDAYEDAADRAKDARKVVVAASATVAKHLTSLVGATSRLESARESADQFAATAAGLHPDGQLAGSVALVDEPDWPAKAEIKKTVDVVLAGPMRPAANGAASAERAAKDRERDDAAQIRACIDGLPGLINPSFIEQEINRLPERLRATAWERARKANADARKVSEKRDAQERARQPERVLR